MGAVRAGAAAASGPAGVLHRRLLSRRSASLAASGDVGGDDVRRPGLALRGSWRAARGLGSPSLDDFTALFDAARQSFGRGDFKKIVPVIFESGRFTERGEWWRWFFARLGQLPPGMRAYGYSYQNHGLAGATPEFLFQAESRGYRTMALAGTRPGRARGRAAARSERAARAPLRRRRHRPPSRAVRKHRDRPARHAADAEDRAPHHADFLQREWRIGADVFFRNDPAPSSDRRPRRVAAQARRASAGCARRTAA